MTKYISKSAVIAEIEERKKELIELSDGFTNRWACASLDDILSFIGTLEAKEVDTENHINCKIGWYDGMFLDYTQEQLSTLLDKIGANVGDEVKIYITK